jgi:hypothetical protein
MFNELIKYKNRDSFEFSLNDRLSNVCNAPKTHGGIYLLYDITSSENLIYIGSSGWVNQDGTFGLRKEGMYDRLVNGKQSFIINKIEVNDKRKNVWPLKMREDKIESLRIEWYVTFEDKIRDIPAFVEATLIQRYFEKHNKLPRWNKDF